MNVIYCREPYRKKSRWHTDNDFQNEKDDCIIIQIFSCTSIGPKRFGLDQTSLDMNHNSSTKLFGADQICFGPKVYILKKDKTNIKDPFHNMFASVFADQPVTGAKKLRLAVFYISCYTYSA